MLVGYFKLIFLKVSHQAVIQPHVEMSANPRAWSHPIQQMDLGTMVNLRINMSVPPVLNTQKTSAMLKSNRKKVGFNVLYVSIIHRCLREVR